MARFCGRELTRHPKVARVAFTGGPGAAAQVVRNSAENFAEVSLELGGKSPIIVFEDANIESGREWRDCWDLRGQRPILCGGLAALSA